MSSSWMVAKDPSVLLSLRLSYPELSKSILSPIAFVQKLVPMPGPCISSLEKRLYFKKICHQVFTQTRPHHFSAWALHVIQKLKANRISDAEFSNLIERTRFIRKNLFEETTALYQAYEKNKTFWDEQDLIQWAIHSPPFFPQKVLFLIHEYSEIERDLLKVLAKGSEISTLNTEDRDLHEPYNVLEVENSIEQASWVVQAIQKHHREGMAYSSMGVYFMKEMPELEGMLRSQRIAIGKDGVTLLPWAMNSVVFGNRGAVWVCGADETGHREEDLFTEEEKSEMNEQLGISVFETSLSHKEKSKSLFNWLCRETQHCYFLYSKTPSYILQEFMDEHQKFSFISLADRDHFSLARVKRESESWRISESQRHGLIPTIFSARSLLQYQKCPMGFFLRDCLKLNLEKESAPGLTSDEEGELIHRVLFEYFSRKGSETLSDIIQRSFEMVKQKYQKNILDSERLRLTQMIYHFIEEEKKWQAKSSFVPRYFELAFGMDEETGPLLLGSSKKPISIRGKIDRVDVDDQKHEFRIIDYKSGSQVPSQTRIELGKEFQLTLYALAVQTLFLPNHHPSEGLFYLVKQAQAKKGFVCDTHLEWQELKSRTTRAILEVVTGIQQGEFSATPENCYSSCGLRHLCSP